MPQSFKEDWLKPIGVVHTRYVLSEGGQEHRSLNAMSPTFSKKAGDKNFRMSAIALNCDFRVKNCIYHSHSLLISTIPY